MPSKRAKSDKDEPLSYWVALACIGFEVDLYRMMKKKGIRTRSALAKRMKVSGAFLAQTLDSGNNYTLHTMTKFARAVGATLEVRLADQNDELVVVASAEEVIARTLDATAKVDTKTIAPDQAIAGGTGKVLYVADRFAQSGTMSSDSVNEIYDAAVAAQGFVGHG